MILGSHDHDPITFYEGGVLIAKAGYDAHYLAAIDLALERVIERDREVVEAIPAWRYLSTAGVAPDPEIQAVVERYNAELGAKLEVPVGTTDVALDSRRATLRSAESNFGNLVADAMREAVGAEVALANAAGCAAIVSTSPARS